MAHSRKWVSNWKWMLMWLGNVVGKIEWKKIKKSSPHSLIQTKWLQLNPNLNYSCSINFLISPGPWVEGNIPQDLYLFNVQNFCRKHKIKVFRKHFDKTSQLTQPLHTRGKIFRNSKTCCLRTDRKTDTHTETHTSVVVKFLRILKR